jgi:hypothetical protein
MLFDTAIIMACVVIAHPSNASSSVVIANVSTAIDIMQDTWLGSGRRAKQDDCKELPEAVTIITLLKMKAKAKHISDDIVTSLPAAFGSKCKHVESSDSSSLADDFELPYVGTSVKIFQLTSGLSVKATLKAPTSAQKSRVKQCLGSGMPPESCHASEGPPLTKVHQKKTTFLIVAYFHLFSILFQLIPE